MTVGRKSRPGFTLLELILVMVLMAVTLAIAAPSLRGFASSRQSADLASRLVAMTQWARSQSVAQGQVCRLNVHPDGGSCWLTIQKTGAFVDPDGDWKKTLTMPDGAALALRTETTVRTQAQPGQQLQQSADYIQFYPTGRCDVGTLTLTVDNGETYLVACDSPAEPYRILSSQEAAKR